MSSLLVIIIHLLLVDSDTLLTSLNIRFLESVLTSFLLKALLPYGGKAAVCRGKRVIRNEAKQVMCQRALYFVNYLIFKEYCNLMPC